MAAQRTRTKSRKSLEFFGRDRQGLLALVQLALLLNFAIIGVISSRSFGATATETALQIGAALAVVSAIAAFIPWRRIDRRWAIVVAVVDLVAIAVFANSMFEFQKGLSILAVIPLIWLSFQFGRPAVVLGVVGNYTVAILPFVSSGTITANPADWGGMLMSATTVTIIGIVVHVATRAQRRQNIRLLNAQHDLRASVAAARASAEKLRVTVTDSVDAASATLAMVDSADAGITFYDRAGEVIRANRAATALHMLPAATGIELGGRVGHTTVIDDILLSAAEGRVVDNLAFWTGSGDDQRSMLATSRIVTRPTGEVLGTVIATRDVTAINDAIHTRDDYLKKVSHDLRTPLTAIIGYLEVIEDKVDVRRVGISNEFAIIQRNSARLLAMTEDILTSTEAHAALARDSINLSALSELAMDGIRSAAHDGSVTLSPTLTEPVFAYVDGSQISEVLDTLLSNALKFNRPGGSIGVSITQNGTDVAITVADTGDSAGAGMDYFSSAQLIVDSHHGSMNTQSIDGEGTTVTVRLPLAVT